ncbi:MAG: beta-methylgalactoside transporter inner membrane component [Firmicutes bacterium ADurb.Bin506]|nr:MAG: beta-methylgalactoside transporter inner membrane component [Firmicutes bacterium ADurb.Bin506]
MWQSYAALFSYSLFSQFALVSTLNKASTLVLTGASAAVGFGSNCVNLGQPGQFLLGAMAATALGIFLDLPSWAMLPTVIVAAAVAGAVWSGLAAFMRLRWKMNEFITTLMLNFVADGVTLWLISGPMLDRKAYSPMTAMTNPGAWLGMWNGLSGAVAVAAAALAAVWVIWNRSKFGYECRVMGHNPGFAAAGGCGVARNFTWAMLLSGAIAGLAGGLMVTGGMQHRFVKGIGANYAWDGVMIAIVAGNSMSGTALYALFFAALQTGAMGMELETAVPSEFALVLQAIVVLFVVASRESTRLILAGLAAKLKARRAARMLEAPGEGGGRHGSGD